MLELNNLTVLRGNSIVFSNLNTSFKSSCLTLVKGKNGSGKTTLLRTIAGFIPAEEGNISYQNVDVNLNKSLWVEKLIYVDTKKGLSQELTVLENLLAWLQMKGWSSASRASSSRISSALVYVLDAPVAGAAFAARPFAPASTSAAAADPSSRAARERARSSSAP